MILLSDEIYLRSKRLFFAVFNDKHIVVESFDKIVLTEFRVVEVDEILKMLIEKYGIGRVKLMTNISQPKFVIIECKFERGSVQYVFCYLVVFD